jgi:hypothetical protein
MFKRLFLIGQKRKKFLTSKKGWKKFNSKNPDLISRHAVISLRIVVWFFPVMFDIFKKDRAAYVYYILCQHFIPGKGIVNVPLETAVSGKQIRHEQLIPRSNRRDPYGATKIPDVPYHRRLPAGVNTTDTGDF